jgi:hypothetical protein
VARNAYPVRDMDTGETWPSVNAAAKGIGVHEMSLREAIENHRACKNRTLVYDTQDAYCVCCKAKIAEKVDRQKLGVNFASIREEVAHQMG